MTVAIAAALEMHIWQVNFISTYLNSILKHKVYMRPPPGFQEREGKVLHLRKHCMASCKAVITSGTP